MTSGYMKCPKCGEDFQYAGYRTDSNWQDVWVEYPEPWKCPKCKSLIIVDKEQGYGLKIVNPPHLEGE